MKREITKRDNEKNFFKEMAYELAGDIGAVDNEEMLDNKKIANDKNKRKK